MNYFKSVPPLLAEIIAGATIARFTFAPSAEDFFPFRTHNEGALAYARASERADAQGGTVAIHHHDAHFAHLNVPLVGAGIDGASYSYTPVEEQ